MAAAQIGMGNVNAALHTYGAIELLRPDLVFFVGVAGSLKPDVKIGDVVVAERIVAFERGKEEGTSFFPRGVVQSPHPRVVGHARWLANTGSWLRRRSRRLPALTPSPSAVVGLIAAGEKIVASEVSEAASQLQLFYSDAQAVEMEGYGVYDAARILDVNALVIRGVSDRLSDKGVSSDQTWQPVAYDSAASFAFEFLATWPGDADVSSVPDIQPSKGQPSDDSTRWSFTGTDACPDSRTFFRLCRVERPQCRDKGDGMAHTAGLDDRWAISS